MHHDLQNETAPVFVNVVADVFVIVGVLVAILSGVREVVVVQGS